MKSAVRVLLLTALMGGFSWPAAAAPMACAPREDILAQLWTKWKERPIAEGLANNGGVLEVFKSQTGPTWTITVTMRNGMTCLVAAGEYWQEITPEPAGDPS